MLLTLREATAFALRSNLDVRIAAITPRISDAQVTEERSIYDVEGKAGLVASDDRTLTPSSSFRSQPKVDERVRNGTTIALAGKREVKEVEGSVGIEQLTPFGGTYEITASSALSGLLL